MTFHLKGLLVFILFAVALVVAQIPRWGVIAAAGCITIEMFLLFGIAGFGRDRNVG